MECSAQVPEHSHDYPPWGIVIEGEMELSVIDGKAEVRTRSNEYLIPASKTFRKVFGQVQSKRSFLRKNEIQNQIRQMLRPS